MCQQATNHFQCGHSVPIAGAVVRCEWARMGGRDCPDFQMRPDHSRSVSVYQVCMPCTGGLKTGSKLSGKKVKSNRSLR